MSDDIESDLAVGPLRPRFPGVGRIAVLRGGGLGDLLFALPAVRSLAAAYPEAEVVLIGTELHRELLADRPGPVSRVLPMPRVRGVHDSGEDADVELFLRQAGSFDLAVQAHGGGRWSNPFLLRLGARWTVGGRTPDAAALTRWLPFRYHQHEVLRMLEVAGLAGAPPAALVPRLAVTDADRRAAERVLGVRERPLVAVHPGATDSRRRWPAERFGAVVAAVAGEADVVVVGTADETELADAVVASAGDGRVRSLAGQLDAAALVGVLAAARVVVANDSGPRHLAQAVGTPTVSVYWMGNVINAGPPGRMRHRVHISWTARCPVCGADCTRQDLARCPHQVSFLGDVPVEDVVPDVLDLLA